MYNSQDGGEDNPGNQADPARFVVIVIDVQDSPPKFVNLPYSTEIDEDTGVVSRFYLELFFFLYCFCQLSGFDS